MPRRDNVVCAKLDGMTSRIQADTPIDSSAQDKLGRGLFATHVARQICAAPRDDGFVVGLHGPWGSGKSSLLNLIQAEIEKDGNTEVFRFNPWLVAGTSELLSRFFAEIARAIKMREKGDWAGKLSKDLETYGELLSPLDLIPVVGGVAGALGKLLKAGGHVVGRHGRGERSLEELRNTIRKALKNSPKRLVFILDDIDRLDDREILEVMRLVRLVGDFPNCTYLLAFDRGRIAQVLGGSGGDGDEYLEKIVQAIHGVPEIRRSDLGELLLGSLNEITESTNTGPFDEELWQNVFALGMFPLFRKVRDVRRYLNSVGGTLEMLGEEIALVDVLALEAVRVLRPKVFALIPSAVSALTTTTSSSGRSGNDADKAKLEEILDTAGGDREAIHQLITRLFPATQQYLSNTHFGGEWERTWSKARRVATERMLQLYLERSYPKGTVTNAQVREVFDALSDEPKLTSLVEALSATELTAMLEHLEDYEDEYPPAGAEVALKVLFAQLEKLSDEERGMFSFSPQMRLQRIAYRLLKRVPDEGERERIVERLSVGTSLAARRHLLLMSGHQENAGSKFISEATAARLEKELATEVANAGSEVLAKEADLVRLGVWVQQHGTADELQTLQQKLMETPALIALLASALTEGRSQTVGDVAVKKRWRLPWVFLGELVGSDLGPHVVALNDKSPELSERERQAVVVGKEYASGQRAGERD